MKTLYVTDLDGTLLNQSAKVSEYSTAVINRLLENEQGQGRMAISS